MANAYLILSRKDRLAALGVAATISGRPAHLLEKDVWVVAALAALFDSPFAAHLVFKGGTSLSKAYRVIDRFSEDIDITYDIRSLVPDLVRDAKDALPPNPSQEEKWTREIRNRLPVWIKNDMLPFVQKQLIAAASATEVRAEADRIFVEYEPAATGYGYVKPEVMIEFGARSTGEPCDTHDITCDVAAHIPDVTFPKASPRVMRAERTFWEKATAIHVYCSGGRLAGGPIARHWYDLTRLDASGYAEKALKDRDLALKVADHKALFFSMKDGQGKAVDYRSAVSGALKLVPSGSALEALAKDYERMVGDGLVIGAPPTFDQLIDVCRSLEQRANS
jgi:hypothetical protein